MENRLAKLNHKDFTPAGYELLAPAGDILSFEAALACGADAIYLGLSDFNARKKADNFTAQNLRECVKKAHFFGVKVYLTLNTLVKDDEISALISLVRDAAEARIDAYIVQDLGVARIIKRAFPDAVLHASTQLGVHNLYGARLAEKFGFKRVVLSRETKLDDIRAIREGTGLEIEYFVQGALCVSFSGNCYLSAKECGASGNRGLCKQLCRLPYAAELDGKIAEGYLLSARDLCLADSLADLIAAGVTSFKIEGRMRRDGYVGIATRIYRKLLDGLMIAGERTKLTKDDERDLRIAYSRGESYLTRAYLDDATPSVIEKRYNNHTGVRIGEVAGVRRFKTDLYEVTLRADCELAVGDGLKFFDGEREVASAGLGDVKKVGADLYLFVTKTPIREGWRFNLIYSRAREEEIKSVRRKADIDFKVYAVAGEPLRIKASCDIGDRNIEAEAVGGICERAVNAPADADDLTAQVKKTGDSGFVARKVEVVTKDAFVPKSSVNALRRDAIKIMTDALVSARETQSATADENAIAEIFKSLSDKRRASPNGRLRFIRDLDENAAAAMSDIRLMPVLCPSEYSADKIRAMLAALDLAQDRVALQLPIIANGKDLAAIEKLLAEFSGIRTLVSENIYGLEFASRGYKVIAGAGHNALNAYAVDALKDLGASEVLPSVESGGYKDEIPLMTLAHCPYKTIFGNDCAHCTYKSGLTLTREKRKYKVLRTKIHNCYFLLF
ncbi:MAG: U32 family peptidase [Bacteroides sp.]|nr:U32 family peptidase [Bacillota bacterium]MCM1393272.1 U32 family peptidase [[Eubacterium] siraeum]MCM1455425.1 U32 family peptidase [Bacteroides sp.]